MYLILSITLYLVFLFMLDLKCLYDHEAISLIRKRQKDKTTLNCLEKMSNCHGETDIFQIPVLFLSVLFRTPYCLL